MKSYRSLSINVKTYLTSKKKFQVNGVTEANSHQQPGTLKISCSISNKCPNSPIMKKKGRNTYVVLAFSLKKLKKKIAHAHLMSAKKDTTEL